MNQRKANGLYKRLRHLEKENNRLELDKFHQKNEIWELKDDYKMLLQKRIEDAQVMNSLGKFDTISILL